MDDGEAVGIKFKVFDCFMGEVDPCFGLLYAGQQSIRSKATRGVYIR